MSYNELFSRNLGWVTTEEQSYLKSKTIAIAGCGGIGGIHAETIARLGVQHIKLADPDVFEPKNVNRQNESRHRTFGINKAVVIADLLLDINPNIQVDVFKEINEHNINEFLRGVDAVVDGIDFYNINTRRLLFKKSKEMGIPATTCAPIGAGAAMVSFNPLGMTFEEYFRFEGLEYNEQLLRMIVGIQPSLMSRQYIKDLSYFDPNNSSSPSLIIGCNIASGMQCSQILKILLKRKGILWAPYNIHYDAYLNKFKINKLRWGNGGILQQLKLFRARRILAHWFKNNK